MTNLKSLRIEKNLTQNELANYLNCTQSAVGKYERGELEPNIETLSRLADFFDCSIDYLVGREDDFGNVKTKKHFNRRSMFCKWKIYFGHLSKDKR